MIPFVTIDQVNQHLRRDTFDDDSDVMLKSLAASIAIDNYLRPYGTPYVQALDSSGFPIYDSSGYPVLQLDSNGDPVANPLVQAATLLLIGELYKSREGEATGLNGVAQFGSLPQSVVMLLYPLRTPVIA